MAGIYKNSVNAVGMLFEKELFYFVIQNNWFMLTLKLVHQVEYIILLILIVYSELSNSFFLLQGTVSLVQVISGKIE